MLRNGPDFGLDQILLFLGYRLLPKLPVRNRFEAPRLLMSQICRQHFLEFLVQLLRLGLEISMVRDMELEVLTLFDNFVCESEALEMELGVLPGLAGYFGSVVDFLEPADLLFDHPDLLLVVLNFFILELHLFLYRIFPLFPHNLGLVPLNHLERGAYFVDDVFFLDFGLVWILFGFCDIGIDGLLADHSAFAGGGSDEFGSEGRWFEQEQLGFHVVCV